MKSEEQPRRLRKGSAGVRTRLFPAAMLCVVGPLFGGYCFAVLTISWEHLGFFPTEFFGVKVERIANRQKQEQIEQIVSLRQELDALRAELVNLSGAPLTSLQASAAPSAPALEEKLRIFFERYRGNFFSPTRIRDWGGQQRGSKGLRDSR